MLNWDDPLAAPATTTTDIKPPRVASVSKSTPGIPAPENGKHAAAAATAPALTGLEPAEAAKATAALDMKPVNPDDKRVVNGLTDINQLAPFKYPWAWEYFLNANRNHWTPLDINMAQDVHDYHHKLTLEERHVYENVLAYLTTSDILAMRNIGLAVMEKMSAPELQIYQARQVYEEALHTWTYQHCIETIGLNQGEIYNRYRVVPEINEKIQIANRRLNSVAARRHRPARPRRTAEFRHGLHLLRRHIRRLLVLQRLQPDLRPAAPRPDERHRRTTPIHHARRSAARLLRYHASPSRSSTKKTSTPDPKALARDVGRGGSRRSRLCRLPPARPDPGLLQGDFTSSSSASSPTAAPSNLGVDEPFPAPKTPCPGSTSRPIYARKRTSSRPGSPSIRRAGL